MLRHQLIKGKKNTISYIEKVEEEKGNKADKNPEKSLN